MKRRHRIPHQVGDVCSSFPRILLHLPCSQIIRRQTNNAKQTERLALDLLPDTLKFGCLFPRWDQAESQGYLLIVPYSNSRKSVNKKTAETTE
jgi:hypothetical protein